MFWMHHFTVPRWGGAMGGEQRYRPTHPHPTAPLICPALAQRGQDRWQRHGSRREFFELLEGGIVQ